jgi:hypothetical protein
MTDAIQAEGLVKRFGETNALAGAELAAPTGTVLAVLGPNGAGKTTAERILATLLRPDEGHATVGGYDVVTQAHQVRQLVALTGQCAAVDESLTGVENLVLIGRLLGLSRPAARRRGGELLEEFALADAGSEICVSGRAEQHRWGQVLSGPAPPDRPLAPRESGSAHGHSDRTRGRLHREISQSLPVQAVVVSEPTRSCCMANSVAAARLETPAFA